jgi:2-polyprenyl-6-methoxyphenol hydroxylase-like FAD-dependent oxidoreductase
MAEQLLEKSLPRAPISGHFGGLPVELDCRPWNTRHPYLGSIPQGSIEQLLTERLADDGISVRRGSELIGLNCDDDGVTATVHDKATDAEIPIRARYLVACDGGHSTVRALLGVPFPGQAGTRPAVLAEVRLTSISDLVPRRISHFAAMVRDGGGYWSMLSPLEGDLYRLVFGPLDATVAN